MVKKERLLLILFSLMYVSSIVYIPIEIGGSSILNKILPIFFFILIGGMVYDKISVSTLKRFNLLYLFIVLILLSSNRSYTSLVYSINISFLLMYIVLIYTLAVSYGLSFLDNCLKFIYHFSVLIALIAFFEFYFPNLANNLFFLRGSIYSDKGHMSSLYSNPNVFGLCSSFSIGIGYLLKLKKYRLIILNLILLLGVVYSGSRMALFSSLGIIFLNLLNLRISSLKLTLLGIFFLVASSLFYDDILRLIDLNLRNTVWDGTIKAYKSNPLLGLGFGQFQYEISRFTNISIKQSPNNMFFGFISEAGIVSSLVFLFFVISNARRAFLFETEK